MLCVRLIVLQNTRKESETLAVMTKGEDCGVEIRTVKSVITDEQGREVVRCENDVVTVFGAEYEGVGQAIETQFSAKDTQETL